MEIEMIFHKSLTYFLAILGFYIGIYTFSLYPKLRNDWLLKIYFIFLGCLNLYTGIVYTLIIFGIVSAIPPTQSSILMRPANVLFLLLPYFISTRMVRQK